MNVIRIYERGKATLRITDTRRVYMQAPWGGDFMEISRSAAAKSLRMARKAGRVVVRVARKG